MLQYAQSSSSTFVLFLVTFGDISFYRTNEKNSMFQMVGVTHNNPDGFKNTSGSGSQQLPPLPPGIAEMLATQTELLH